VCFKFGLVENTRLTAVHLGQVSGLATDINGVRGVMGLPFSTVAVIGSVLHRHCVGLQRSDYRFSPAWNSRYGEIFTLRRAAQTN
tara:strand:- start:2322 stop:2576 length:255 start_codon:yes stop_codon:yes gene_type:complete